MNSAGEGRTPPKNDEAERALLGALLLDPERIGEVAEVVRAEDFYAKRHQLLFECLERLHERNDPVDFVSVGQALRAMDAYQAVGGSEYLIELSSTITTSAHSAYHATLVAESATLRRLIHEATEMVRSAYETRPDGEAVRDLVDECEQRMFRLSRDERGSQVASISDAIKDTFRRIDAMTHRDGLTGVTTGFLDLDQMLCGLNAGDLLILAARPSMGKTAFALNVCERAAMSQPEWLDRKPSVLLFSLEMGRQQLVNRMLCTRARVDAHRLRTGQIPADDRAELANAADELSRTNIFIDDSSNLTALAVRSRARRIKAKHGLDMILVDYLQLLTFPKSESRQQEISNISRTLKAVAREFEVPVIALAQLSRQVESRDDKRPLLSDLRESGSLEQDADVVMMLFRPEYYAQYRGDPQYENLAEVIIGKHRNGPTGSVKLNFFPSQMRFEDRAPQAAEAITL
ncbi:MAG: replicative DNA helicase [Planctomycetota bacterium]